MNADTELDEAPYMAKNMGNERGEQEEENDIMNGIYNYFIEKIWAKEVLDIVIINEIKVDIFKGKIKQKRKLN